MEAFLWTATLRLTYLREDCNESCTQAQKENKGTGGEQDFVVAWHCLWYILDLLSSLGLFLQLQECLLEYLKMLLSSGVSSVFILCDTESACREDHHCVSYRS